MVTTKVDYRNLNKKLARAYKEVNKQANLSIFALADAGMYKAKSIAPFDTGKTAKAIRTIKRPGQGGKGSAEILTPNALGDSKGNNRKVSNFNLPLWMHLTKGIGHKRYKGRDGKWYTNKNSPKVKVIHGDAQYMYTTARWLNTIKKNVAQGHFDKINLK